MQILRFIFRFRPRYALAVARTLAIATTLLGVHSAAFASELSPGDILFTEFFNGWHKLNPQTGQVTQLPWPSPSLPVSTIRFDTDGAILINSGASQIRRFNPSNGNSSPLNISGVGVIRDFDLLPSGDLVIAEAFDLKRFSRTSGTLSSLTGEPDFFSPHRIVASDSGDIYLTEFFEDLLQVDSATGAITDISPTDLSIPDLIDLRTDGDLVVQQFSPSVLSKVDPTTGAVDLFGQLPSAVSGMAVDGENNVWVTAADGVFKYGPNGGAPTLLAQGTFFSPRAIAVVPQGWTAPPAPEPAAVLMLGVMQFVVALKRR